MIAELTTEERLRTLTDHPGWTYDQARRAFHRHFALPDFSAAIGFMMRVALEAERTDHHPEWTNVHGKLDIWLTTHDVNGVSTRDVQLMGAMDRLLP